MWAYCGHLKNFTNRGFCDCWIRLGIVSWGCHRPCFFRWKWSHDKMSTRKRGIVVFVNEIVNGIIQLRWILYFGMNVTKYEMKTCNMTLMHKSCNLHYIIAQCICCIHMWLRYFGDGSHVGFLEDFEEEEEGKKGWSSHVTTEKLNLASFIAFQFCELSTSWKNKIPHMHLQWWAKRPRQLLKRRAKCLLVCRAQGILM